MHLDGIFCELLVLVGSCRMVLDMSNKRYNQKV